MVMDKNVVESQLDLFLGHSLDGFSLIKSKYNLLRKDNVYHYTDIAGFKSIIEKQELWASHISFMNDRLEFLHGKELFKKHLNRNMNVDSDFQKTLLQNVIDRIDDEKSGWLMPHSSKDVFSLSFSYERDSLEMWRGYGRESGIAIGFDWERINNPSLNDGDQGMRLIRIEDYDELKNQYQNESEIRPKNEIIFIPVPVVYDDYIKDNLVDDTIKMVIDYYNKRAVRTKDGDISVASDTLLDLIFLINPLLKHRGFKGECECRFVENYVEKAKDNYQIKFRNRGGIILPYIKYKMVDVNCRPIKRWPIHEIVIGPGLNQSKVIQSVKYFLEKKGMEDLADKVVASDIPYVET